MTTGWDALSDAITLDAPWETFWVRPYLDPPLGAFIDMQMALDVAKTTPNEQSVDALIATIEPLIGEHNIVDRDGQPIVWRARSLGTRLILAIASAIKQVNAGGAPADPLPGKRKRANSRRRA